VLLLTYEDGMMIEVWKCWKGLQPGDVFKVQETRGDFEFIEAKVEDHKVTGILARGGRKGYEKMRILWPDRVIIPTEKELQKQRKAKKIKDKENASNA
jgi:hypothetical protein